MTRSARVWVPLAIASGLALIIGANWQLLDIALRSQPGCVAEAPDRPAAKPGC